jgi:putative Holliday junction resolvase
MPILDITEFAAALPARGAVLGIDPGEKRIGVSVSDTTRLIASSLDTVARAKFADDAAAILKFYDFRQCVGFVIGLPLNMDGSSGPPHKRARLRPQQPAKRDAPLLLDERLSTAVTRRFCEGVPAAAARRGCRQNGGSPCFRALDATGTAHRWLKPGIAAYLHSDCARLHRACGQHSHRRTFAWSTVSAISFSTPRFCSR